MRIRAAIFDIYGTLLELAPPPANAEARWCELWNEHFSIEPRLSLAGFAIACDRIITREHDAARALGIQFPEVYWPDVAAEASPELVRLSETMRDDFLLQHAGLARVVQFAGAAAETLRWLADHGCLLGIASNCQPYTSREFSLALASAGLTSNIFTPNLCFRSFEHGFSKPDPHAFRLLTARLRVLGIAPNETLMVGDRLDNDIEPARAQGWQTWHLAPRGWRALRDWLQDA